METREAAARHSLRESVWFSPRGLDSSRQLFLTFLVWLAPVFYGVFVIQVRGIDPQVLADEAKNQEIYRSGVHLSDHFENLFEVPVLFFAGIPASMQAGLNDERQVLLA